MRKVVIMPLLGFLQTTRAHERLASLLMNRRDKEPQSLLLHTVTTPTQHWRYLFPECLNPRDPTVVRENTAFTQPRQLLTQSQPPLPSFEFRGVGKTKDLCSRSPSKYLPLQHLRSGLLPLVRPIAGVCLNLRGASHPHSNRP